MEKLQKIFGSVSKDSNFGSSLSENVTHSGGSAAASSSSLPSVDTNTQLVLSRQARQGVSLANCAKLCAVCFFAGVFVGFTLKTRVRRWASKLLQKLKDN